jgi:2'-5' RNA ligase
VKSKAYSFFKLKMYNATAHQQGQVAVIGEIESAISKDKLNFSTVEQVADYANDSRICLTSVHFPRQEFIKKVRRLTAPLKKLDSSAYYYPDSSLHMTVKNLRVIDDPPSFDEVVVKKAQAVFAQVMPKHHAFQAYYYRLLLFPGNLALIGTTDPELDEIVHELDYELAVAGIPDNKTYINDKHFFSNVTLCRFSQPITMEFRAKVAEISESLNEFSYTISSVSLVSANASMNKLRKIQTWELKQPIA